MEFYSDMQYYFLVKNMYIAVYYLRIGIKMKKIITALFVFISVSLFAQSTETYIELLRSNLQMEKKALVAQAMELSPEQNDKFWPIYNEFQLDASKLGDKKLTIIKKYAENYMNLTNDVAEELMDEAFDIESERLDMHKKYYKKVKKALNAKYAGKFIQLISRINNLVEIQLSAEIPLIPVDKVEEDNKN